MAAFKVANPHYATDVLASFSRQKVMTLLGASIDAIEPGSVRIVLPHRAELTQQHGFFHGGIVTTIGDSAAGYSAYSLFPPKSAVLTVELKVNFVAPAEGERLVATGRVKKHGRTLTIVEFEVAGEQAGRAKDCAYGLATMMCLPESTAVSG